MNSVAEPASKLKNEHSLGPGWLGTKIDGNS